ncbi:MAG: acetate--CoA ligase [Acidobacteriota bacterium]|nr:acetate--CoA ligase [Acidobacteriota bacterium]
MTDVTETIEKLSHEENEYPPPKIVAENAQLKDARAEYERWRENPDAFWAGEAEKFGWLEKWSKVSSFDGVNHKWFIGGKTNITLNMLDRHAASDKKDKTAFIWLGENGEECKVSYEELLKLVCRFANGLKSLDVKKGDRVVIYMPLTIEGVVSMLACARIGAIHSVVYAGLGQAALRDRIVDASAKILIAGDAGFRRGKTVDLKSIVDEAVKDLPVVEKIVLFRRESKSYRSMSEKQPTADADGSEREINFNNLLDFPDECQAETMDSEDVLFILYTSGTTGKPKGVVHVHGGYMVGTTYHLKNFFDVGDADIFWCMSDIGWIVGHSYIVYAPLCAGATTIFREGAIDFPHQGIAWEIVEKYKVTKMFTAPTAIRFFMRFGEELPKKYDITSLKVLACAGEPLNPEAWRWAQTHLCGDGEHGYCVDNWWQTELGAPTIATPVTMAMRMGKAGVPLAGVEADVVDAEGNSVAVNVGGRLVLRRPFPSMMRTVWNDAARYERMWKQVAGCYVSGDVAVKDADGYIQVLGRADDVLNVAGHRIGTADVESALVSHDSVAEAAVIGIPDEIKGEAIVAFVQLRNGYLESDELLTTLSLHVRKELGPIAMPSKIKFVKTLPKTRSGKIMRRYLKALETGADVGDISTLEE